MADFKKIPMQLTPVLELVSVSIIPDDDIDKIRKTMGLCHYVAKYYDYITCIYVPRYI